jgi:hypothetical protein
LSVNSFSLPCNIIAPDYINQDTLAQSPVKVALALV